MLYTALLLIEDEPEFGQFFKDISSMLKEKTGETGENTQQNFLWVAHKNVDKWKRKIPIQPLIFSGPSLLIGGFLAYALSKELLVLHDEVLMVK